ncbi:MAG: hypothetical protein ACR2K1_08650, partial [Saprospiraceae bacterium]
GARVSVMGICAFPRKCYTGYFPHICTTYIHTMIRYTLTLCAILLFYSCQRDPVSRHKTTGAGEALRFWAMARTFPDGRFYTE